MLVKKELLGLLQQKLEGRFQQSEIEELAEEVTQLEEGWEELSLDPEEMGYTLSVECPDICALAEAIGEGQEIRFFRKKSADVKSS